MQRIDENIYIDDSLVTCAEYQLFIDEMLTHGRYHQPDHWASYQFPKGHGLNPILGVRSSDAGAFCEWLTVREQGEWIYRQCTLDEAVQCQLRINTQTPIGYWTKQAEIGSQFVWAGAKPDDARNITQALAADFNQALIRDLTHDTRLGNDPELHLARVRANELDHDRATAFISALDIAVARACTRALDLNPTPDIPHGLAVELANIRALTPNHSIDLKCILTHARSNASLLRFERNFDVYIDLFTLQERIAGRSSAFEGIRLVKERMTA